MNRTGLLIALAVAVATGLVFGIYPALDLAVSAWFFDPAKNDFALRWMPPLGLMRDGAMWVIAALVAPAFLALAMKLARPRRPMLIPARAALFLIATLAIGPGLLTNVLLKDHWYRSRPIDVPQFNGEERFTPWWDPRGGCVKNCSFVAGEGAAAFWTLAPAALAPPPWRALAYAAALGFGLAVGGLRIAFGAHFMSDMIFSGVLSFLVVWLIHGLIYRWRYTRIDDEAVERAIERIAAPPHDFVAGLFGRRSA